MGTKEAGAQLSLDREKDLDEEGAHSFDVECSRSATVSDIGPDRCSRAGPGLISVGDGVLGVTRLDPVADTLRLLQGFLSHPGSSADRSRMTFFGGTELIAHLVRSTSSALLSPAVVASIWELSLGVLGRHGSHLTTASYSERVWWRVLRAKMLRQVLLDASVWTRRRADTALEAVNRILAFAKKTSPIDFIESSAVKHCMEAIQSVSVKIASLRAQAQALKGGETEDAGDADKPQLVQAAGTGTLGAKTIPSGVLKASPKQQLPRVLSSISAISAASSGAEIYRSAANGEGNEDSASEYSSYVSRAPE